jgi:hypothetical protein
MVTVRQMEARIAQLERGRKLGERIEPGSEIFSGAVLILVGLVLAFPLL